MEFSLAASDQACAVRAKLGKAGPDSWVRSEGIAWEPTALAGDDGSDARQRNLAWPRALSRACTGMLLTSQPSEVQRNLRWLCKR